jgi:2-polyprenyl-6-methoxyphenol hydroxylase-like FAD-dependent oxidoreductase
MEANDRTAIVVGGSIAGLAAANLLLRSGWQVDIYERVNVELAGRGAGIVTHADLFSALREAGIPADPNIGIAVRNRRMFARDGRCEAEIDFPQVLTSWDCIYQKLRSTIPDAHYHRGRAVVRLSQDDAGVTVYFADGGIERAALVIGADGYRSTIRAQLFPSLQPNYAGYIAWRGLVDEADLKPGTQRDLFQSFAFALLDGEEILGYPVSGAIDDVLSAKRRYNWVWYRPATKSQLLDLLRDATGQFHDLSIPPPLIRSDVVASMREAAARILPPQFEEIVRLTSQPFFQPIYDLEVPSLVVGRVALIGDAAFIARPHVGAGVTKAAHDALTLAASLRDPATDVLAGLRVFDAERQAVGARIVGQARRLGHYMQAQTQTAEERQRAETQRCGAAVMQETASLAFLHTGTDPVRIPISVT